MPGQPLSIRVSPGGDFGGEGGGAGGDALAVDPAHVIPVLIAHGRTVTSSGRSSGQHGRGVSTPITASAACGSPVQQAGLTTTTVLVPFLSDGDESDVGELADVVRDGGLADAQSLGQLADGDPAGGQAT